MAPQQANGYYPRLNAAMVSSGKFNDNIVSLMGRFISGATDGQHVSFQCSDGGTLSLSVEHADFPNMDVMDGPVVEVVGQVMKENEVAVRLCCITVLLLQCESFKNGFVYSSFVSFISFLLYSTLLALCYARTFQRHGPPSLRQDDCDAAQSQVCAVLCTD
jgi:uncharacterized protein YdeI (BOF family)